MLTLPNRIQKLLALLVLLSFGLSVPASAGNPYLHLDSSDERSGQWSGFEWGDSIESPTEAGTPIAARVKIRRLAKMSWGQIVAYQFEVAGDREVRPLFFLIRDEVILELTSDDMEFLVGAISAMKKAPFYEPGDVRAQSKEGELKAVDEPWSSTVTTAGDVSTYLASHPSGHFSKHVWKRGRGLVEYSSGYGARKDGFRLTSPALGGEFEPASENIGGLRLGQSEKQVMALISEKPVKGEIAFWGGDGEWHQDWKWPALGLEIGFSSAEKSDPMEVFSIVLLPGSKLKTAKGVGIGASEKTVRHAYGSAISKEESNAGDSLVVGSVFEGALIFTFEQGKVVRIFLGIAAE